MSFVLNLILFLTVAVDLSFNFYIPGVFPVQFHTGDIVEVKVIIFIN